ncbi:hypothetical protein HK100_007512 [Physocladia obscura]|uniref:DNA polymerase delta catalytic subunit n=1 Tax=Physocladia obscura TaxID=109957 RepID=A0AAD5SQA7_9FUNG|nr:hypothetical protein HK100_007512 [Physocladia obscura]
MLRVMDVDNVKEPKVTLSKSQSQLSSQSRAVAGIGGLKRGASSLEPSAFEQHLNATSTTIAIFQQMDIDEYEGQTCFSNPEKLADMTILRLFGVTDAGVSAVCHVHGFLPYFYVPAPAGFTDRNLASFIETLDAALKRDSKRNLGRFVVDVRIVAKKSIFGYQGPQKTVFLQIFFHFAQQVAAARRLLEGGFVNFPDFGAIAFPTFESSLAFELRFMIDTKIRGASWVELQAGKYKIRTNQNTTSLAQIEVDVDYKDIISHEPEGDWSKIAPLRILSFDIECCGRKGVFPDAKEDSVIQIANLVTIQGSD